MLYQADRANQNRRRLPLPLRRIPSRCWLGAIVIVLGCGLGSCGSDPPAPAAIDPPTFRKRLIRYVTERYPDSEAEVYLTGLAKMADRQVLSEAQRMCETLKRGGGKKELVDLIQTVSQSDNLLEIRLQILKVAEVELCPPEMFPPEGWQRSLFFWQERWNGGQAF